MFEGVVSEFETEGISAGWEAVMMPEVEVSYHWFKKSLSPSGMSATLQSFGL